MRLTAFALLLVPLLAAGCARPADQADAAQGAQPPIVNPVGPVPGPGRAAALPPNPYAGDPVAIQHGRQLFVQYNCSGCHGGHAGGGMGPSLRDTIWRYGGSDADIFSTIAEGRQGMPAWGTKLNAQQIWELAAYIKTMRTPNEPDPPTP